MSLADDVAAVRTGVALTRGDHVAAVRVVGPDSQELVDRVSPRPLFARQGQMLHTLLLDDDAAPIADVYLCCDEDDYLLVAEGPTGASLAAYLRGHAAGLDATAVDLTPTHGVLCLDGPYAWELLAEVTTPDVVGLSYLSFFHTGRFTCLRGGKTGEYGYGLLIEREPLPEIHEALAAAGRRLELREIPLAALELAQLEAGFWNVRREVRPGLTPVELQLQWRTSIDRAYPGAAALAARRRDARRRVVMVASEAELAPDADVTLDGEVVGTVLHAGPAYTRGGHLGVALLDRAVSHAGLTGFACGGADVRTISSPAVNNRSLYVDPQRHTWASRARDAFPPLLRPPWS